MQSKQIFTVHRKSTSQYRKLVAVFQSHFIKLLLHWLVVDFQLRCWFGDCDPPNSKHALPENQDEGSSNWMHSNRNWCYTKNNDVKTKIRHMIQRTRWIRSENRKIIEVTWAGGKYARFARTQHMSALLGQCLCRE